MTTDTTLTPRVLWAQRSDVVYLTFEVVEAKDPKIEIDPATSTLKFTASTANDKQSYACTLPLYDAVETKDADYHIVRTDRTYSCTLTKSEDDKPYWPRLCKSGKLHFVHTDFGKWKDEDEEDEEAMSGMGGMPDMGGMGGMMPGMGGMGGMPGMPEGFDMSKLAEMAANMPKDDASAGEEEDDAHDDDPYQTKPKVAEQDN